MATITLRQTKGTPLTVTEVDANFSNLNADKIETADAVSTNTASKVVKRDASGNFSAGTITAALSGNATTSTTATNLAGGSAGTVPYQSAAGTTVQLAAGTSGQVLTSSGAAAPSWTSLTKSTVGLGNVENTALSTWAGTSSITTLGTITTGTWSATSIGLNKGGTGASLTAAAGGVIYSGASAMAITAAGTSGQYLMSNGTSAPSWSTVDALPSQSGNGGKYLTTNGSVASWATISAGITATDDVSTDASYYPSLFTATSGSQSSAKVSSTKLYFNPSTGTLNATVFNSLSDLNQKTAITKITNPTETLKQIDGFEFDWVSNGKHSAGVIAQYLEKILPFLVQTNENGEKSVNYSGLIAYLIESNKELASRIEVLENDK